MLKRTSMRALSLLLTIVMFVGLLPLTAFAAGSVTNYADFLSNLKQLEIYADNFGNQNNKDPGELVLNFIRTGVERYQGGNWTTLAGAEITAFTEYVEDQDALNGTTAMDLRDIVIDDFKLPNGNQTDFGHMFGTMNISYVASAIQSDDLAGWAGDVCDLLYYSASYGTVPSGTVEEMAAYIRANCFGVDADDAFGWDDFYGDMDAYYLVNEYQAGKGSFSELIEVYFTAELDDTDRAAFFLNNRFKGVETKEEVRTAVYNAYRTNVGLQVLEADRGLSDEADLRQASCYAFADYLYSKAEGLLVGGGATEEELPENGYYTVFSSTESILAPGISQKINYAQSADGKQMVYYVATVDVNRDDVTIMVNYRDNNPSKGWGMQRVEDQTAALVNNYSSKYENFSAVVATNGEGFNTTTREPGGLLVMAGKEWHPVDGDGFFAILKDGSAMIGSKDDYETYKDQIQDGIGLFGQGKYLVKDGQITAAAGGTRASRTAIGIKADGSVIMMVLDGRQEPFSCGGTLAEIAQIMLDAGCVEAVNLDGGGSSTYMSKPEGEDNIRVINRPSDGYARSVASSLVAVSTAKPSTEFDRAIISSDYDYITAGTSMKITATGVSNTGFSAAIPAGAYWTVSDASIGSITADGTFTALANGEVDVQLMLGETVIGSKKIGVVVPDAISMKDTSMNAVYGVSATLPLVATYNENTVAVKPEDFMILLQYSNAGTIDGFTFTAIEAAGYRTFMAGAMLLANQNLIATITVNLYRADEVIFDFDNATAGNQTLAWLREVSNSDTTDELNYSVIDPDKNVDVSYVFALDMSKIGIPDKLEDIVYMLPGADLTNASAWGFLLDLAERVSVLTEVRITAQIDKNLDVDISELKVINDFFVLSSATLDDNNKLTVTCKWVDQTQAIDEATANPLCILTGLKASVKDGAEWDGDELIISNTGTVVYDIYLRASSLYSFAKLEINQQTYGLYPYTANDTGWEGGEETGAHFAETYADFQDSFILNKTIRNGWIKEGNYYYYYVDGAAQTGIQYVPSREDASVDLFYRFDENGICLGTVSGVIEYNGALYNALMGKMTTGWVSTYDDGGDKVDYYFDTATGKAVDGQQTIGGYNYTFTDKVLTRGDLVTDAHGTRYRWAGKWLGSDGKYIWFDVDGKSYITGSYNPYVLTGFRVVPRRENTNVWSRHLFGDDGALRTDYVGLWNDGKDIFFVKNGYVDSTVGLVEEDGYYYYISPSTGCAVKNATYWINNTNDLVPVGLYTFDENGRMTNPPVAPNPPTDPNPPIDPNPPVDPSIDGIVEEGGNYYYYINGVLASAGGYELTDEDGDTFYIYVRSATGTLATGKYWPSDPNGVFESKIYDFGTDGRYYPLSEPIEPDEPDDPIEPEIKNGIYEEGGKLRYYVNGVMHKGGMVKLEDETGRTYYIYVRTSTAALATGNYWPTVNEYLPSGIYNFGVDGKYYPPVDPNPPADSDEPDDEVLNGVVEIGGELFYYENGVKSSKYGLIKLTDDEGATYYIYVRSSTGRVVTGKYWITVNNGDLESKIYDFGTDGKYYP